MKEINGILIPDEIELDSYQPQAQQTISQTIQAPPPPGRMDKDGNFQPMGTADNKLWVEVRRSFSNIVNNYMTQGATEDFIKSTFFMITKGNDNYDIAIFWRKFDQIFQANKENIISQNKIRAENKAKIDEANKSEAEKAKGEVAELKETVNQLNDTLKNFLEAFNKK